MSSFLAVPLPQPPLRGDLLIDSTQSSSITNYHPAMNFLDTAILKEDISIMIGNCLRNCPAKRTYGILLTKSNAADINQLDIYVSISGSTENKEFPKHLQKKGGSDQTVVSAIPFCHDRGFKMEVDSDDVVEILKRLLSRVGSTDTHTDNYYKILSEPLKNFKKVMKNTTLMDAMYDGSGGQLNFLSCYESHVEYLADPLKDKLTEEQFRIFTDMYDQFINLSKLIKTHAQLHGFGSLHCCAEDCLLPYVATKMQKGG